MALILNIRIYHNGDIYQKLELHLKTLNKIVDLNFMNLIIKFLYFQVFRCD